MDDVFVFTVEATELSPVNTPYESPEEVPLEDFAPTEEVAADEAEDAFLMELAEGDFWCGPMTYFQILADPDYQAWIRQTEALQHYVSTGDFSVFEPWQHQGDSPVAAPT